MTTSRTYWRHASSILLLFLSYYRLEEWYQFLHHMDYVLFVVSFLLALLIGPFYDARFIFKEASLPRKVFAGAIVILALPWGEWLRLALPMARENWSMQIFRQSCFVYGAYLVLRTADVWRQRLEHWAMRAFDRFSSPRSLRIVMPLLFLCFSAWLVFFIYHRTFTIQDPGAHFFQAKILRAGNLFAPAPPVQDAFNVEGDMLVLHDGKWFTMYLPGFPLLLAVAMFVHAEWLLCPLLGAATLAVWIEYCRRWHERYTTIFLSAVFIFSPMIFLMFSNHMVHCAELFWASCAIYLCRRESEEASAKRSLLLGLVLFLGVLTRGFSFLPFVAPALAYAAWKRLRNRPAAVFVPVMVGIAGALVVIALYQAQTTGSPTRAAYDLEYNPPLYYGFHGVTLGQVHTPLRALENTSNNLLGMNSWLNGWPAGSLIFLLLFILIEKRIQPWDIILVLCCLGVALFYFFFVFQDLVLGPRYWFAMAPILLLFLVRGIFIDDPRIRSYSMGIAGLSILVFLAVNFPRYITRYQPMKTSAGQLSAEMKTNERAKTLIFLDKQIPQQFVNWNDPFLRGNIIVARDRGSANAELINVFPGYRPVYFRRAQSLKKNVLTSGYSLFDSPNPDPPGYISFFDFALVIQSADDYVEEDVFDICYIDFLSSDSAVNQLAFIAQLDKKHEGEPPQRTRLRAGLLHAARMVLLPKLAYERYHEGWKPQFDSSKFRDELREAVAEFHGAGDSASSLLRQMEKVRRRIDQDQDGKCSDNEIQNYLSQKLRILQLGT